MTTSLVPEQYGRGLDTEMIQHAIAELGPDIGELATCIREDHLQHTDFLDVFGFKERFRSWGAHLDLRTFDPSRFNATAKRLHQSGIRFIPYAELRSDKRREYRGRGIATVLKVRSLSVAKELGATKSGTGGGGTNSPMKRLNQKLGYEVGPEWVTLLGPR